MTAEERTTRPRAAGERAAAWPSGGTDLHGHRVLERIGAGAMGVVYKALDVQRQRLVALKTLPRLSPSGVRRLKGEFRSVADMAHPNLVLCHELVSEGQEWF